MKIGIATLYKAYNYGGFLQAFAMQEVLKGLGHEVYMLEFGEQSVFDKLISGYIAKSISKTIYKNKLRCAYKKDRSLLNILKYNGQKLDAVIVGSDEVWNLKNTFKHIPQYFGSNINAKKKIAYAPSIGFCPPEEFVQKAETENLKCFDVILARDENTRLVCERILKKEIKEVCDPTILYIDKWKDFVNKRVIKQKDFIVYYSYGTKAKFKEYTLKFAKEKGLQIISVGFKHDWCDKSLIVRPMMFLELLNKASYVVTTTFHGSVFSTILKKKVVIKPSGQKVVNYLNKIDMQDKIFYDEMSYEEFKGILEGEYNYTRVRELQDLLKNNSLKLLNESLL